MTDDFEESLREALGQAVPTTPVVPDRAASARGYARRVRRTRVVLAVSAAAAVVAAVVVIPSVLASPSDHTAGPGIKTPQVRTPLVMPPLAHPFTCPREVAIHNETASPDGVVAPGAVLARICPANTAAASWSAPAEPLVIDVDSISGVVNGLAPTFRTPCGRQPFDYHPSYLLTFQYADGHTVSVQGDTGGCDGVISNGQVEGFGATLLLRAYLGAIHDQRARFTPPQTQPARLRCLSDPRSLQPVVVDGRGPGLVEAMVCDYVYPTGLNPVSAGTLSPRQIQLVNADIAAHASRHQAATTAVRGCQESYGLSTDTLLTGVDRWGDQIELLGHCSVYTFFDRNGTWYWTPTQHTSAMLDSVLHSAGRISGRLLLTGGLQVISRPVSGYVMLNRRSLMVGDDGRFSGSLPPGRYRVIGYSHSYDEYKGQCRPLHPFVTVRAGQTVHVSVLCQMK